MRETWIRYAVEYDGDYQKILKAIKEKHPVKQVDLQPAITVLDEDYPKSLLKLKYPPLVLFYKGNRQILSRDKIAVVGSRNACAYGIESTRDIINHLKDRYCIVSGLAKGIDAVAHSQALTSIAVLGNGLDICYPYENKELQKEMEQHQLILSEYPIGVKPMKEHFPFRNRIIAGLSKAIIVTQAAARSGTMLTVNEALNLGIDVYSVAYPYDSDEGQGCNMLLEQGAMIITKENIAYLFDK